MTANSLVRILPACVPLLALSQVAGASVELPSGARYVKVFVSSFSSDAQFDDVGRQQEYANDGRGVFRQVVTEYRWAFAHRWNVGYRVPVVENTFSFAGTQGRQVDRRSGVTDLTLVAERRYLTLPQILALEGEIQLPAGYGTGRTPWLGNGTRTLLAGLSYKRLFAELPYAKFWIDGGFAVRRVLGSDPGTLGGTGNLDGSLAMPFHGSVNWRPIRPVTLLAGVVGSRNSARRFLVVEAGVKYRITYEVEVELLAGRALAGRNSSAGHSLLVGVSFYTSRLWE